MSSGERSRRSSISRGASMRPVVTDGGAVCVSCMPASMAAAKLHGHHPCMTDPGEAMRRADDARPPPARRKSHFVVRSSGPVQNRSTTIGAYFDAEALRYVRGRESEYSFRAQKRIALAMLPRKAERILDAGCGPALLAAQLLERSQEVWGIDVSEQMIAWGRARIGRYRQQERCHLMVGDVQRMSFADGFFDAVVSLGMLEYLPSYRPALSEIHRCLRPGGVAVLSLPTRVSAYHLSRFAGDKVRALLK